MGWFEDILINPFKLLLLLMLCVFIGWLLCTKLWRPISNEQWRCIDFFILLFSSFGVFCILGDNREFFCERKMNELSHKISTYEWRINWELDTTLYNRTFTTTFYTPKEICLIEADYKTMHSWILMNKDNFIKSVQEKQCIDTLSFRYPVFKTKESSELKKDVEKFKYIISEYNKTLSEYDYYRTRINRTGLELVYNILAPIFFVLGLAYQFVRWFWEGTIKRD